MSHSHQIVTRIHDELVDGYVVVDTLQVGLCFGGCRVQEDVDELTIRRLARAMTHKLLAHGLPMGGAKAGLRLDPSAPDASRALARFGDRAADVLRSHVVLGKDMGATTETLDRIYGATGIAQLGLLQQRFPDWAVPDRLGELHGYLPHMTGRGVACAASGYFGDAVAGKRVAIQGAGAVGIGAAFRLSELGATIVAINDARHTLAVPSGLSFGVLRELVVDRTIDADRIPIGATVGDRDALFRVDADILVLAAASNAVGRREAEAITAELVIEGANFPLRPDADDCLAARGIPVIPDVVANSSSAAFVTKQMAAGNRLLPDPLWSDIDGTIRTTTAQLRALADHHAITLRAAFTDHLLGELTRRFLPETLR